MSDRFEEYRCPHCGFKARASARLNSHISQSPTCLEKIVAVNRPPTNLRKRHRTESPAPGDGDHVDDQPIHSDLLYSSLLKGQPSTKRAHVEVEEESPVRMDNIFDEFKPPAGIPQRKPPDMSNDFTRLWESQQSSGSEPWAPFSSIEDWDYARWILNSDLSQKQIDEMLALDLVSRCAMASVITTHKTR